MLVCFASLLVCRTIVETITIIAFPVRIIVQLHRLERFISWCPALMALTASCVLACTLLVVKLRYYIGESWHSIAFLIQEMRVHKLVKFEAFQLVHALTNMTNRLHAMGVQSPIQTLRRERWACTDECRRVNFLC